jgi:hypothetical protein
MVLVRLWLKEVLPGLQL